MYWHYPVLDSFSNYFKHDRMCNWTLLIVMELGHVAPLCSKGASQVYPYDAFKNGLCLHNAHASPADYVNRRLDAFMEMCSCAMGFCPSSGKEGKTFKQIM